MANAIEWTSNQRAFKDSKVARNVFRLTLCVRGGGGNSNSKTEKYLSVSFVSKPWKARTVARAATTRRWVSPKKQVGSWLSSFRDLNLICRVSHETKQVSDLYERPPAEVDFRSSKRLHENGSGFELPSQLLMIAAVTNLKSVRDNQTVSQEQMNPFLSPCFIHAAYCGTLFYTILQDSINSLFSPFSITHSSKQLKPTNLPDLDAFWKANTFSCSKGLIFVLWSVS